jgi:hypothetical protein
MRFLNLHLLSWVTLPQHTYWKFFFILEEHGFHWSHWFISEYNVDSVINLQETLLIHNDLSKSEGLDDLLVELEKEGLNSKYV